MKFRLGGRAKHRRRAEVGPWRDEDEELLLKTYGKTSWELAREAERGYDLSKIKHEFTGLDHGKPCRVCGEQLDSWPHKPREVPGEE